MSTSALREGPIPATRGQVAPATRDRACADGSQFLQAAAAGDQLAWDRIVEQYSGLVWAVARAHRLSHADAADVAQATWMRLVENLTRIRDPSSVGAWLATVARRECLRTIRDAARCRPQDDSSWPETATDDEIDASVLSTERDAALWRAFERLSDSDKALLRLLTADPTPSYEEIAAALCMPVGSIGPTRGRCLKRLRRELERIGVDAGRIA